MKVKNIRGIAGKLSVDPELFHNKSLEGVMAHVSWALLQPEKWIYQKEGARTYYWVLEAGEEMPLPGGTTVIAGVMRRGTNRGSVDTWNFETNAPETATVSDMTLVKFHYVFDPATEVVVIQQAGKLSSENLLGAFARLININTEVPLPHLTVNPYRRPELLEAIHQFVRITKVKLSLVAANPRMEKDWEKMEQLILGETKAKKAHIELSGEDLNAEKTIIEQGALKVLSGQGETLLVEGVGEDGQVRKVDSKDYTYSDTIKVDDTRKGIFLGLGGILQRYLRSANT